MCRFDVLLTHHLGVVVNTVKMHCDVFYHKYIYRMQSISGCRASSHKRIYGASVVLLKSKCEIMKFLIVYCIV